jgi:hypothetical protein
MLYEKCHKAISACAGRTKQEDARKSVQNPCSLFANCSAPVREGGRPKKLNDREWRAIRTLVDGFAS